tara:strand:- start:109 stop:309 length:201 start_codon:yes stop_codon:yes gene_type:complete
LAVSHTLDVVEFSAPSNIWITLHGTQAAAGNIDKNAIEDSAKWRVAREIMGDRLYYRSTESSDSVS